MKWEGLGEPQFMNLEAACTFVEAAFQESCFLVGSAADSREYRDVDVRIIMDDDKYEALFGQTHRHRTPFHVLICVSVSAWLKECTGLPVDFQIQKRRWVQEADWQKVRWPLGIEDFPELRPPWAAKRGS